MRLRRGAAAAWCADSLRGRFAARARAQAAPEEKKEKTPPNKDDVDKILRDLKLKMPGCVAAGAAADAASWRNVLRRARAGPGPLCAPAPARSARVS